MAKKKKVQTNNLLIIDLKGSPYYFKGIEVTEDDISNIFLESYTKIGEISLDNAPIKLFFGIDEEGMKAWNYNVFLSGVLGQPSYSDIMIFADEAELDHSKKKMKNSVFKDKVFDFIEEMTDKMYPEKHKANRDLPRSKRYGFSEINIRLDAGYTLRLEKNDLDGYFDKFCSQKYLPENTYTGGVRDHDTQNECSMFLKKGLMYVLDNETGIIDAYFHPMYGDDVIITEKFIN